MVDLAFTRGRDGFDQKIWHQIEKDVPRTRPGVKLWMHGAAQRVRGDAFGTQLLIILKTGCAEPGTYSLHMGHTASSKWVCAGH